MVFEIVPLGAQAGQMPDAKTRKAIYKQIQPLAHENLLLFVDHEQLEQRTQSLWYWVKRESKTTAVGRSTERTTKEQAREHLYLKGQPGGGPASHRPSRPNHQLRGASGRRGSDRGPPVERSRRHRCPQMEALVYFRLPTQQSHQFGHVS